MRNDILIIANIKLHTRIWKAHDGVILVWSCSCDEVQDLDMFIHFIQMMYGEKLINATTDIFLE